MKWETDHCGGLKSRCGHLYVRIEMREAYRTPKHPDYEPASYEWSVEPDDEDKSYRRALAGSDNDRIASLDEAKLAAEAACRRIVAEMEASLSARPGRPRTRR